MAKATLLMLMYLIRGNEKFTNIAYRHHITSSYIIYHVICRQVIQLWLMSQKAQLPTVVTCN